MLYELGRILIDAAKLVLGSIIFGAIMQQNYRPLYLVIWGGISVVGLIVIGLFLIGNKKK